MALIFHSLFILIVGAYASDDQSLMQQGVGIDTAETSAFQQGIGLISDNLRELQLPGKMRQMAIDALVRSVQKDEKVTPENENRLQEIIALLQSIKGEFAGEQSFDVTSIDAQTGLIEVANNRSKAALATAKAAYEAQADLFSTCIVEEQNLYIATPGNDTVAGACAVLEDSLKQYNDDGVDKCEMVVTKISAYKTNWFWPRKDLHFYYGYAQVSSNKDIGSDLFKDDMHTAIVEAYNFMSSQQTHVDHWNSECDSAHNALAAKKLICDGYYDAHVTNFCLWHGDLLSRCASDTQYYNELSAAYGVLKDQVLARSDKRLSIINQLDYVICLIEVLIDGTFQTARLNCPLTPAQLDANNATYWYNPADVIPFNDCDTWDDATPADGSLWNDEQFPFPGFAWHNSEWPRVAREPAAGSCQ